MMKILWIYPEPSLSSYKLLFARLSSLKADSLPPRRHFPVPYQTETSSSRNRSGALKQHAEQIAIFRTCSAPKPKWFKMFALIPILGWRLQEFLNTRWAVKQMGKFLRSLLQQKRFDVVLFHGREGLPVLDGIEVPVVVDCGDTNCPRLLQ